MPEGHDLTLRASTDGRRLTAHLVRPGPAPAAGTGPAAGTVPSHGDIPGPAVLVIHEAMGLNDDIRRIAARFAEAGYVALAPDLVGPGFKPLCIARFFMGIGKVGTGRPYRELGAFHDWLARQPDVDPDRVGLAGFCMGGGFVILYAARGGRQVRAVAPFYGALPDDREILNDLCPTVASYGGRDRVFGTLGAELQAALEEAGIPNDVKTYPDAGHSFMSQHGGMLGALGPRTPMHDAYHPEAAEDAWARTLAFFATHLASAA